MAEIETHPKPCPYCGDDPKTTYFNVNPMFGGGGAWEVACACGFREGLEYRTRDAAVDGWNALVDDWDDMDDDYEDFEDEARRELAREEGWEW